MGSARQIRVRRFLPVGLVGLALAGSATSLSAAVTAAADCAAVATLAFPDTEVTAADPVAAGTFPAGATDGRPLPAYCRVRATIDQRIGAGGVAFGIRFELRLPDGWNRRFFFQGGAGGDGVIFEPVGVVLGWRAARSWRIARPGLRYAAFR